MDRQDWVPALGLLVWLTACTVGPTHGGKVLIMPVDGSHWLSMQLLVRGLAQRGHEIVVLVPETSLLFKESDHYRMQTFQVPYSKADLKATVEKLKEGMFQKSAGLEDLMVNLFRMINFTSLPLRGCEALLYNEPLMQKLRGEGFELLLTDPFLPCGSILAETFSLPVVYFLRGLPCGLESQATQSPSPPSFVPCFFSGSTDRMNFPQRVKNVFMAVLETFLCKYRFASFDELTSRYLQKDITYRDLIGKGAIWLLRYDFTFEYPRPLMPNMVHIGGINCVQRKSLPVELESFVNGSGEHGFVVFTLGSMVSQMPEDKANQFFEAFRQIPQRVLWRYTGPVPNNLPDNVKLMKWLPQNDLLAHPKARAFLTHGGTHGIYEGICNGVPLVLLPLFGDQSDNAQRMAARGVGEVLSMSDLTPETLLEGLNKVINNTSYKEKMMKLSAVHNDHPIKPLDLAIFWTEFVMRHKGAAHLRSAAHDLNWIQYSCLDVISLFVVIVVTVVMVTIKCCKFTFRKCCRRKTLKKKKE